ncbi:MAG: hypothetical protein M1586_02730 [Patescibacteria group bacterium]|nr:hypothetical protein [Patescibacteria group bacterium]MCL5262186.1 hypothetical protein [Patescibacteria group bacterium]
MLDWLRLIFIKKAIAAPSGGGGGGTAGGGVLPGGNGSVGGGTLPGGESLRIAPPTGLPTDLGALIATIMTWVLWIASAVLIYIIITSAWDLINSRDVVAVQRRAKGRLFNAIIGFVLILLAQSIPGIIREFFAG